MRALFLALVLALPVAVPAAEVVLEEFETPQASYPHTMGGEFPGARAQFTWAEDGWQSPICPSQESHPSPQA